MMFDVSNEEIAGWCVGETLDTAYPIKALEMALRRLSGIAKEDVRLIHHSDRGCQYASAKGRFY
jgi:transposase InsO family protein